MIQRHVRWMVREGTVLRIRVLGTLEVFDGAGWATVSAGKPRALLAVLIAQAPGTVSVDALIDEVWGERPPKSAQTQIHGYVMRLRRLLHDEAGDFLVTSPPGYRLALEPGDLDSDEAERRLAQASEAQRAGHPDQAATAAEDAIRCWRGEAFADVELTTLIGPRAERLRELRLTAREELITADLARAHFDSAISHAREHLARHPLRENVWQQLMIALWSSGRQAEALAAYRQLREQLADDLGVDPCVEARDLHARILAGEPPPVAEALRAPVPESADDESAVAVPGPVAQLPADISDFTGRDAEIERILAAVTAAGEDQPPSLVVVHGPPGAGKSSVALHAARQLGERFPDGQLYLDAAGTSESAREPRDLVAEALMALGISSRDLPEELAARAALLRSVLAARRILILVDDAGSSDQVRALLPPNARSAIIVSSRRLLTDLSGSVHVELGPLGPQEAYDLLARIVGTARVSAESAVAHQITRACGMLPLSIRIAGGKLLGRPSWSLQVLLSRLEDEGRRLSELRLGDLDVRSSVDLSLGSLEPETRRAFGLMGLLGAQDLPGWVVGPLLDRRDADGVLDSLVDASLVALSGSGTDGQPRYRIHDLLRVQAVESCQSIPVEEQRAAVARVLASWLDVVENVTRRLPPNPLQPPRGEAPRRPLPDYQTRPALSEPFAWFDAQRTALVGAVRLAAEWELPALCWELAAALGPYFDDRARFDDWRRTHELALTLPVGDLGQAVLLRGLAQVHVYGSDLEGAEELAKRSLSLFRLVGHQHGEVTALSALVTCDRLSERWELALEKVHHALKLVTALENRTFEAQLRCSAGIILVAQRRPQEAHVWFRQSLRLARESGDAHREAVVLRELSQLQLQVGDPQAALVGLRRAEEILATLQDERCIAFTLTRRAELHRDAGDFDAARTAWSKAAATFRNNGTLADEAMCYRALAELEVQRGHPADAGEYLHRAKTLWKAVGHDDKADALESVLLGLPA